MATSTNPDILATDRSAPDLLREMRAKAETEQQEVLETARRRAAEIEEQTRLECERLEHESIAQVDRELSAQRDRILGTAREEARADRVALKCAEIDRVFESAQRAIGKRIGDSEWGAVLAALLDEALQFVGPGAAIVVANEDLSDCRKWIDANAPTVTASADSRPRGGVVATSADGRRRATNDLLSRLGRAKLSGAAEIARVLFSER